MQIFSLRFLHVDGPWVQHPRFLMAKLFVPHDILKISKFLFAFKLKIPGRRVGKFYAGRPVKNTRSLFHSANCFSAPVSACDRALPDVLLHRILLCCRNRGHFFNDDGKLFYWKIFADVRYFL